MAAMMRAIVMNAPGGPEVLKLTTLPIPIPAAGQVLIRVKAFGINRSEMYTRQGHSPGIKFPRVLGIEATGLVESAPGNEFKKGEVVATAMGGMGRMFDGGYAEYTCVPASQVMAITTKLSWEDLGALPELIQTTWGSLFTALRLQPEDSLLIRGGTTSIGLAAVALAKGKCSSIASTTRNPAREEFLKDQGVDEVYIDDGDISSQVKTRHPGGFTKVLELIGITTLKDSLSFTRQGGLVCVTGIAGGKWIIDSFNPMEYIPNGVGMTIYSGSEKDFINTPLNEVARLVSEGKVKIPKKVFTMEDIVKVHTAMEESSASGKMVVLT